MHCPHDRTRRRGYGVLVSLCLATGLAACGGGDPSNTATADAAPAANTVVLKASGTLVSQPASTEGRLLASNCFQCHGTLGTGGFERIRGSEASEVLEFMTKPAGANIMAAHAQGYTPAQLKKIIAYLQQ